MRVRTTGACLLSLALSPALAACGSVEHDSSAAASTAGNAHHANVRVTAADGCVPDRTDFAAGGITFDIENVDATGVTEVELLSGARIVGEKENLPPGFNGTFSVNATAGEYTLFCPGASPQERTIRVTGKAEGADEGTGALLRTATSGYGNYVDTQVGYLLRGVRNLDRALHGHDLDAARAAYAHARAFYEKIEPVAESFTVGRVSLDADIDARANDVPPSRFTGFHRIEKGLFAEDSLAGLARYGDGLVDNVQKLRNLTATLKYQPTELANGAQELLDEVANTKITGEEERYSHIDMLDIACNVEGSQQAFAQLVPVLERIDPDLTHQIQQHFEHLNQLVQRYREPSQPSGYVLYPSLTGKDKRGLAAAVKAVQEPLSRVAGKVAAAG